jgi:hypothetical protein
MKIGILASGGLGLTVLKECREFLSPVFIATDKKSNAIIEYARENLIPLFIGNPRKGELKNIHISNDLWNSEALKKTHEQWGSYILRLVYPEGSPCHPAYPAGHAVFSGAVTTILKAFFDNNHQINIHVPNDDGSDLVKMSERVKVGDELDKLASNIAFFRNAAGVHYRSDGLGIELGERIAIEMLQEHFDRYPHKVKSIFNKRDGSKICIRNYK